MKVTVFVVKLQHNGGSGVLRRTAFFIRVILDDTPRLIDSGKIKNPSHALN